MNYLINGDVSTVPPPQKQFADVEFQAKDLIITLRKEGYSGFQIQIIGVLIMNAGQIMAFDAVKLGMVPPLPDVPKVVPPAEQKKPAPVPIKPPEEKPAAAPAAPAPAGVCASESAPTKETKPQSGEGGLYTCQECFGVVDENAKKASMLFFNKILCASCCDKKRVKTLKEQQAAAAKSKGAGK